MKKIISKITILFLLLLISCSLIYAENCPKGLLPYMGECISSPEMCQLGGGTIVSGGRCLPKGETMDYFDEDVPIEKDIPKPIENIPEEPDDTCPEGYIPQGNACIIADDDFTIEISPKHSEALGNGKTMNQFTISIKTSNGNPAKNEKINLQLIDSNNRLDNIGRVSNSVITTDDNGKATFTYVAPLPPNKKRFDDYLIYLQAKHSSGTNTAQILIKDTKPTIKISASPKVIRDDVLPDVSYLNIEIIDPDSTSWTFEIETNIGNLKTSQGDSLLDVAYGKIDNKEFRLRWIRPDDKLALRDFEETMHKDQMAAYDALMKNAIKAPLNHFSSPEEKMARNIEYLYNDMKSSIEYIQEDSKRMEDSVSFTENFLNEVSSGLEYLQAFYGAKGFITSKDSGKSSLKSILADTVDPLIGYGVDLLQSRVRAWADAEREAATDTIRLPVIITIKITDDSGQETTEVQMLQYVYHFNPNKHIDRLSNPNAG